METRLVVYNTTAPNLKDMVFTVGALEDALALGYEIGVPSHIGHDMLRPFGWSVPRALYMEPGLASLAGLHYLPQTPEEQGDIGRRVTETRLRRIEREAEPHLSELRKRLSDHLDGTERAYLTNGLSLASTDLAKHALPELFDSDDIRHGLVPINGLTPVAPGVFERDGLLVYAHQYFRRSLSRQNSLNDAILGLLQTSGDVPNLEVAIALDPDQVGLASSRKGEKIELEYWWGPKFNNDLRVVSPGVTTHSATDMDRLFSGVERTEFWWHDRAGERWFECEEILHDASRGIAEEHFGCRYAHSIVREDAPIHLDGSVRVYDDEQMTRRRSQDISKYGKGAKSYVKLWRVDGPIELEAWKELLTHHFRGNKLVGEYFGGVDPKAYAVPTIVEDSWADVPIRKYVPSDMQPGDGIRLAVAYSTPRDDQVDDGRYAAPRTTVTRLDATTSPYVEEDIVEVRKAIRRRGGALGLPRAPGVIYIDFQDLVSNLPVIVHAGQNASGLAQDTVVAVCDAFLQGKQTELDRILSFALELVYEERVVTFSYAGHTSDLAKWFRSHHRPFPCSAAGVAQWAEQAHSEMDAVFEQRNAIPLERLLQPSGLLSFERRFLDPTRCKVWIDDDSGNLVGSIALSDDEDDLRDLASEGEVDVAAAMQIKTSRCLSCGKGYRACPCMRSDGNGGQEVTSTELVSLFLTNRKV